jgi:hypothetical protein
MSFGNMDFWYFYLFSNALDLFFKFSIDFLEYNGNIVDVRWLPSTMIV